MTLPPVVRIFFAIELPDTHKKKIGDYISALKKKSKPHVIRWTRLENLHVTLQFLAEVKSEDLDKLIKSAHTKIKNVIKPMPVTLGKLNFFPTPYRPRVIVFDINPQIELTQLAELIGIGIKEVNYNIDDRPFRAHLTLGRIKQPKSLDLSYLPQIPKPEFDPFTMREVVLYRSEPQVEGSVYTVLERLALEEPLSIKQAVK